jgi:multiple sugar transport system substrate-binding protein
MNSKFVRMGFLSALSLTVLGALPALAQEPVVITWFVGLGAGGQPEQIEVQNAVVAAFNEAHDDIELQIQIVDNDVAGDTLSTLIASGQAPDIVGPVGYDGSNAFDGAYLDLEPLINASGYDLSRYSQAAVDTYRDATGTLVGIPFAVFPSFVYYRTDLFDEAGLPYPPAAYGEPYINADGEEMPWDLNTLRDLGMLLTVDGNGNDATMEEFDAEAIEQWGFVFQWGEPRGMSTMWGANTVVAEDGTAVLPPQWTEAFNWFYDGIWVDHFIPNAAQDGSDALAAGNAFSSGNVAMAHTHLWYTCCIGDQNTWNIAPMPAAPGGVPTAKLHGDTFRILNTTEHPEEAFTVLTYLLDDASTNLLAVYGGLPYGDAEREAYFASLDERFPQGVNWDIVIASLDYADNPNHEYNMPNYLKAKDRIGAFQTLFASTPDLDIDAEMDTLIADLNAIFAEVAGS